MEVKIKKLHPDAVIPKKGTEGSAGYDVYLPREYKLYKGRNVLLLDLSIELPYGYEAKIEARSGFSAKGIEGMSIFSDEVKRFDADVITGKVDADYRGNMGVIIYSKECFRIKKWTRIAQLTIYKVEDSSFKEVEELSETERSKGGFGHTGTN